MNLGWHKNRFNKPQEGRVGDQDIVDHIRSAVLMQRLTPNTKLPEITLGEVFGVSRSVVRKALTRLDAEHVIDQRPNQVARVRAPSIEETRETFSARRLVEGEIVALLAGKLETSAKKALQQQVVLEKQAYENNNEPARIEHSLNIHHLLAESSPNSIMGAMLTDLVLRTSIVIALYKPPSLLSCYLEGDHAQLLSHLINGDAEAARNSVHAHLNSLESLLVLNAREPDADLMAILGGN
tara:strand:+ start:784 stop:1500 length:717 start_codon:yes stop_codon:yes gene_type:complete